MEQNNTQESNIKLFLGFIQNPAAITAEHSAALESLVEKYPYSQLLRSFYARSIRSSDPARFEKELTKAALLWQDRTVLRQIIEEPETLKNQSETVIGEDSMGSQETEAVEIEDAATDPTEAQTIDAETESVINEGEIAEVEAQVMEVTEGESPADNTSEDNAADETDQAERLNIDTSGPAEEMLAPDATETAAVMTEDQPLSGNESVEEPVQDEGREEAATAGRNAGNETQPEVVTMPETVVPEDDELDRLIKQHVAPAEYLKDAGRRGIQAADTIDSTHHIFRPDIIIPQVESNPVHVENKERISRYDDDKMPYSFLWWLDKTRKEHTENYQPYVSFKLDTTQPIKRNSVDQLSSQIIENIFHLQSPVDELESAPKTVPFTKRKEDYILEKFIREEPQIKPPNSEKLDNENKARKSAEDPNDLVSETLAHIYTDQMLFHKAIETYKKLSLKFPEKSTYFADQIRELEKKIN